MAPYLHHHRLFFLLLLLLGPLPYVSSIGINYGTLGNNLPSPKKVAQLLQSTLIDKVKIYDTNPEILQAFSNTGIDLIVAVENSHVANISKDVAASDEWFATRVQPFIPATSIVAICVGNEYLTINDENLDPDALVQAMKNLHSVLLKLGLDRKIKVTTPHSMAVLASSFPPSSSTFSTKLLSTMSSIVGFLADTGAPFMVNAYPYFAYRDNPSMVDIEYALLGNFTGVHDPKGYIYHNMLDAQIDAVRSAIDAVGFGNMSIKITVSESGGHRKEIPATLQLHLTMQRLTTPARGTSERNFGIFNGDGSKVYDVDLSCEFCSNGGAFEKMSSMSSGRARGPSVGRFMKVAIALSRIRFMLMRSYAMNAYYQMHGRNYWNCDFKGTGLVTLVIQVMGHAGTLNSDSQSQDVDFDELLCMVQWIEMSCGVRSI
ncbi:serine/threonine-protein kinase/endoribonuclease IRE1b-like isoform X1 [Hibiscus syriacus]|uniref:glucan endo-1,3-beta-D-glucosidase n=1 Tax=Hibiscus syriacus TaxID=106335 RepID=A0A6A3AI57_HIBSY|nr:serine/threonine-protein kinase/endoribonuclease IRE1b-like isoform X1 [Hibiscus syriacus]